MSRASQHRWNLRLGALLFLVGQCISAAHASEFGTVPHEHAGYSCLAVLLDDPEDPAPAAALQTPALKTSVRIPVQIARSAPIGSVQAVRPPATGPPSI